MILKEIVQSVNSDRQKIITGRSGILGFSTGNNSNNLEGISKVLGNGIKGSGNNRLNSTFTQSFSAYNNSGNIA